MSVYKGLLGRDVAKERGGDQRIQIFFRITAKSSAFKKVSRYSKKTLKRLGRF
jgi:hypothetical protein